ncbi:MAG: hypothetical protein RLZZ319_292 [Actinomycetota bacterium]|jgi:hypothetical protein
MRNSAGFAPLPLPQFAWGSVDKRRTNRTSAAAEAVDPPAIPDSEVVSDSTNGSTGEESN